MTITIESALKLDKDQQTEIENVISKKVDSPQFVYKVNKEVLGGLRVTMGGKRIDLSLASKLRQVQQSLG